MKLITAILLISAPLAMTASTPESPELALEKIGQLAIEVDDLDRATTFYRDTLKVPHLFSVPGQFSFFQCGEVRLLIGLPEKNATRRKNTLIYFKVAAIRKSVELLTQRGVKFLDQPHVVAEMPDHTLWMVHFHDSEGNDLLLMSEVAK